ncbi:DUF3325 domain-containing protein [Caballeronia sp. ATUFL_M2_KS44]|uniref:DUF3325 domain-containing protein n=1 Tax=Caballeronia sp. ATUFL_M2_KS44 TaxID=2921767 RepID=UPI002027A797|nr:DUF3325 domain-containing protein [Caballeronia sp. ATUFL_M2_KS44]
MTPMLAVVVCIASFSCLAMAMERHQLTLFKRLMTRGQTHAFRIAGWCGLAFALWMLVANEGWAMGLVRYSGCTSLGAGIVYIALIACERVSAR